MTQVRDGSNKISILARALIAIVGATGSFLKSKYPPPSAVSTLVDAILALAPLLANAEAEMLDFGGDNASVIENPETIAGINPAAAAPPVFVPPEP